MKILICYASTEGQTRKICRFAADRLIALGHSVEMLAARDTGDLALAPFDAVILAGSVHIGRLQHDLADFAQAEAPVLNTLPTLFLQVSLAAAGDDAGDLAELDRIAADFCTKTGWTPGAVHQIAGAFRFSEYDFFRSWAMRWIAHQKGEEVDPTQDKEYTDWAVLSDILADWAAAAPGGG